MKKIGIILYNDSQRKTAEEIVHRMVKRAVELKGTVTGEHGVGLVKRDYLNHEVGETTVDAMRRVCSPFHYYTDLFIWKRRLLTVRGVITVEIGI